MASIRTYLGILFLCIPIGTVGCGDDGGGDPDAGPQVTTDHCSYQAVAATGGSGGTVEEGPLTAGAAEAMMRVPVGTGLGAYTARAGFLGAGNNVDNRGIPLSGAWNPSIGIETAPWVRALALSAGGETVVIIKMDIGLMYEALLFDLEARLGPEFSGKVLLAVSHSHSGWGQFSGHSGLMVGVGEFRQIVYDGILDQLVEVAEGAIAARRPAKIGIYVDEDFDPDDQITRDRRGENDELMGGPRKDDKLFMIRVDGTDDVPIAALPVYGVHGTLNGEDNSLTSTDAIGGLERVLQEEFAEPVVIMHLQGAAGDVSPNGHGGLDCSVAPGNGGDPCFEWLRGEGHGRVAAPVIYAAWEAAGNDMRDQIAIEMLTRSIELGPNHETFTIRDGALGYAPFDLARVADGEIWDDQDNIISPIDEFNAPVGAALCESEFGLFPNANMPGVEGIAPYGSCLRIGRASEIFSVLMEYEFESDETHPICQSTRTTVSALRLGDYLIGTLPGEPTVMAADLVRERSPVPANRTIVVGYAQGHIGYLLRPEDWLQGGYEPSIGFWGPLEAEYVIERLAELLPLGMTAEREDGAAGGVDRVATMTADDGLEIDDPAPMAGTVPETVPADIWLRSGTPQSAQPAPGVSRVSGIATFVWIGDDPLVATPAVTLEREVSPGVFEPVLRNSTRPVADGDLILTYTPQPLVREGPQTHYWAVEWQAVPWLGIRNAFLPLDSLEYRAAVPADDYRFRVRGADYEITSDPFAVLPATFEVSATHGAGNMIDIDVAMVAPQGYRLLDLTLASNQPVPVRTGRFDVTLITGGGTMTSVQGDIDGNGRLSVDGGANAGEVVEVRIVDEWGNIGSSGL